MITNFDKALEKLKQERLEDAKEVARILNDCELMDDDGYPTDEALKAIELWDWDNHHGSKGWFDFIKGIWAYTNYWSEDKGKYAISTGGWSGNESIIDAMKNNKHSLWYLNWVSSRRGGHYEFELHEFNDDNNGKSPDGVIIDEYDE